MDSEKLLIFYLPFLEQPILSNELMYLSSHFLSILFLLALLLVCSRNKKKT